MSSREEVQALRGQLEEQRERARKEMQEAQRHGNDAQADLERSQTSLRRLEEEVCVCVFTRPYSCLRVSMKEEICCFYYPNFV